MQKFFRRNREEKKHFEFGISNIKLGMKRREIPPLEIEISSSYVVLRARFTKHTVSSMGSGRETEREREAKEIYEESTRA